MILRKLLLSAVILIVTGCASTQVVEDWFDTSYNGPIVDNFLIVGMDKQTAGRRIFEDAFVAKFQEAGLIAQASYTVIDDAELKTDSETMELAQKRSDVNAILISRIVEIEKDKSFLPPSVHYVAQSFHKPNRPAYRMVIYPGHSVTNTTMILETSIYNPVNQTLLWSASTKSINPDSIGHLAKELAGITVERLRQLSLLKP
ncbi:MAG: hypothetical protein ACI8P9_004682 [Parasphingorhabdus sp.]|jgi:hypothetical protein